MVASIAFLVALVAVCLAVVAYFYKVYKRRTSAPVSIFITDIWAFALGFTPSLLVAGWWLEAYESWTVSLVIALPVTQLMGAAMGRLMTFPKWGEKLPRRLEQGYSIFAFTLLGPIFATMIMCAIGLVVVGIGLVIVLFIGGVGALVTTEFGLALVALVALAMVLSLIVWAKGSPITRTRASENQNKSE